MKVKANAKINFGLDIVSKRDDGYHDLNTVFCEIPLHDILEFTVSEEPGIRVDCSDKRIPLGERNLVHRAVKRLFDEYHIEKGIDVYIEKNIPSAAGLGGGSSNAAAAFKTVNKMFELNIPDEKLMALGADIGADVPFFIMGGAAIGKGIGEILKPVEGIKLYPMLLAVPGAGVSTAEAFKATDDEKDLFHPDIEGLLSDMQNADFGGICEKLGNSFEIPVFRLCPAAKKAKNELLNAGAGAAVMTGSGSGIVGVFKDIDSAEKAAEIIEKNTDDIALYRLYERV